MAVNECSVGATPEQVFAVLAAGKTYEEWVVGAKQVRSVDADWPAPGTRLHHTLGAGPVTLKDDTRVLECDEPNHLLLQARGRPFGTARVRFEIAAEDRGSRVRLREWIVTPRGLAALNPLLAPLVRMRNAETLRRFTAVVMKTSRLGA